MAVQAWKLFNTFRQRVVDGTIDLDTHVFKVALFTSTLTPNVETQANLADLSGQVANGNGYTTGGVTTTVTLSRSTTTVSVDFSDPSWTASGGSIVARYAVIYDDTTTSPADALVAYTLLDTTPGDITLTDGNTLTLQLGTYVFQITGGT